jgi:septal ring factor EnvC (AmiA/AmiB activator)
MIKQLKVELDTVKDSRDELLKNLETSESKIGELNKKAQEIEKQIENSQSQLIDLRGEKEALASAKKQLQRQVSEHLNSAYRLGQQSHVKLLLNQRDPALIARNLKYFDYLAAARAEQISAANHTIERISRIEPEMASEQAKLSRNSQSLREQQQALKRQFEERQLTLKKLEQTIATKDQELKASEQDQQRLQNLIERVVRIAGDINVEVNTQNIKSLKGRLPWPTNGPIRHSYNSQRVAGKIRWHGILIGAPTDSPVKAIHHGQVVFAEYLRGHGLLVIIDHGHGVLSLYAHNKSLYKTLGEWVNAGEIIANVGNTGGQTESGLYFEIRQNGEPTNPQSWLKKSA